MKTVWRLILRLVPAQKTALLRGTALSLVVLAMGAALLGLSGWFVTAAAVAGVTGLGIGFDFFQPSAGVRGLALGRAAARYGERLLTHDATLRVLSDLRIALMEGISRRPHEDQAKLRSAQALNRLTSDVDALDGLMLRLAIPIIAAICAHLLAFVSLWMIEGLPVAAAVALIYLIGGTAGLAWAARAARRDARAAETALQNLRSGALELMRGRADLAVAGALAAQAAQVKAEIAADARARRNLEALDRRVGAVIAATTALAGTVALAVGGQMAAAGQISPARAAIGLFVALALAESLMLLRRGMAETGRIQEAGERVLALIDTPERIEGATTRPVVVPDAPLLRVRDLGFARPGAAQPVFDGLNFDLHPGKTLFLTGPSGAGKSTALAVLAGLLPATSGRIEMRGADLGDWPEDDLRAQLTLVAQRSRLLSGSVAENLALSCSTEHPLTEGGAWAALRAVALDEVIAERGGLGAALGEGGIGLSGGQSKRLALARAALRQPAILMLDEPTEGLDAATARSVLQGLRACLPGSGLIIVSHRRLDSAFADHAIALK